MCISNSRSTVPIARSAGWSHCLCGARTSRDDDDDDSFCVCAICERRRARARAFQMCIAE